MGESRGVWSRVRALPVGAQVVLAGWSLMAVISLPLALAGGSEQTVVTAAAGARVTAVAQANTAAASIPAAPSTARPATDTTGSSATTARSAVTAAPSTTSAPTTAAPTTTAPPPPPTQPPPTSPPPTQPPSVPAPVAAAPATGSPTSVEPQPIVSAPAAEDCHPSYDPCVPIASDVDCAGGKGNGPAYVQGPITVLAGDPYGLDADDDGIGCED